MIFARNLDLLSRHQILNRFRAVSCQSPVKKMPLTGT